MKMKSDLMKEFTLSQEYKLRRFVLKYKFMHVEYERRCVDVTELIAVYNMVCLMCDPGDITIEDLDQ